MVKVTVIMYDGACGGENDGDVQVCLYWSWFWCTVVVVETK